MKIKLISFFVILLSVFCINASIDNTLDQQVKETIQRNPTMSYVLEIDKCYQALKIIEAKSDEEIQKRLKSNVDSEAVIELMIFWNLLKRNLISETNTDKEYALFTTLHTRTMHLSDRLHRITSNANIVTK